MKTPPPNKIEYTTIVGAGVSGLYSASQLAARAHPGDISVREKDDRIGGRLYTQTIPNSNGLLAENGAMRFYDHQVNVMGLIDDLKLKITPAPHLSTVLCHYVRGKRVTLLDYKDHDKIPYDLRLEERGKTPMEIEFYAYNCIAPGYSEVKTKDECIALLDEIKIDGRTLHEWDLDDLMKRVVSDEAYQLMHDASGFSDLFKNRIAYVKLLYAFKDFRVQETMVSIDGGAQSLAEGLAKKLDSLGVRIYTGQSLNAVTLFDPHAENPVFVLSFAGQDDVYAKHVILTLSPMALLTLDKNSVIFHNPKVSHFIQHSKRTVTSVKVFLVYDKPWWHQKGLKEGRMNTCTESRQIFDFGYNDKGAILCIYKDVAPNWTINNPEQPFKNREEVRQDLYVPCEVIDSILAEFRLIFDDQTIEAPHTAFWKVWSKEQGAFFQWKPGYISHDVMSVVKSPYPNIHITGDNFGSNTGWVDCAIEEANKTLLKFPAVY